ncbi:MAG: hypothetical protein HS104_16280 [Polyangiaceae bacterium]|nr:hypothetical protein [Polyangiaceae bacterium]
MSNPEDPKAKGKPPAPGVTGAGRSASARSIGEELGDLDFEPDALLDSLLSDEPRPSAPAPIAETPAPAEPAPTADADKLFEPDTRAWSPDEVTLAAVVGHVAPAAAPVNVPPPASAPGLDEVDALLSDAPPISAPPPLAAPPAAPPRPRRDRGVRARRAPPPGVYWTGAAPRLARAHRRRRPRRRRGRLSPRLPR